mgnify:CR=1 FL=1
MYSHTRLRSKNPNERVLVSDGLTVFSNPAEAGDEPYLLASNLVGVAAVVSDSNRFAAAQGAINHLASDCFVLDDGFQHLQLARDLDIVSIDATNPWGGGHLLPFGRLREGLTGLKRASCFVMTRCDQVDTVEPVRRELAKLSGERPIFLSRMVNLQDHTSEPESPKVPSDPVAAFCGIGNPQSFFTHLTLNGHSPIFRKSFPDHYSYTQSDVDALAYSAKQAGAQSLITTAKDAVKLHALQFSLPCYSLEIEIQIDNDEQFRRLLLSSLA